MPDGNLRLDITKLEAPGIGKEDAIFGDTPDPVPGSFLPSFFKHGFHRMLVEDFTIGLGGFINYFFEISMGSLKKRLEQESSN